MPLISLEGIDGAGKSTQVELLAAALRAEGWPVVATREPGGTALGERLRDLLKGAVPLAPRTELILFAAARAELVEEVIRPALDAGQVVLCDRFADSTRAYQGAGRGLDPALVEASITLATGGLAPSLTVLLDLPPALALARRPSSPGDRFESNTLGFLERVRAGYLELARAEPARWLVLDATLPIPRLQLLIWHHVREHLGRVRGGESLAPPGRGAAE